MGHYIELKLDHEDGPSEAGAKLGDRIIAIWDVPHGEPLYGISFEAKWINSSINILETANGKKMGDYEWICDEDDNLW